MLWKREIQLEQSLFAKSIKENRVMCDCEDCKYNDNDYCELFDDVVAFENCIFKQEDN